MIMLFLMSYSLLCCSTNDPPWHPRRLWTAPTPGWCISNLSGVCAALGEVLVSQVFNKPFWGHEDRAWRSEPRLVHRSPSHACSVPPRDPSPMSLGPSPIVLLILPLHALVQLISVASSPIIRPHSTLLHLPRSACFALRSAHPPTPPFNTCQGSWGTSYTARISFERAPQDVIIRIIITGPYGWCYISVPSHTEPWKCLLTSQPSHHTNQNFSLSLNNVILICNWPLWCVYALETEFSCHMPVI